MTSEMPRRNRRSRRNRGGRAAIAGPLLVGAAALPWNLYFGLGIPGSDARIFGALGLTTLLALLSLLIGSSRVRAALNTPQLLLVAGFVLFDAVQTVRYGGTPQPPGGVGPGAWLGAAGAALAIQPEPGTRWPRALGIASVLAAGCSVVFNLYWRVRYALPGVGSAGDLNRANTAIIATSAVYAAVAWAAVFVGYRWAARAGRPTRLAVTVLGGSALVSGALVWLLPVGRSIDGFHGIAQNTSTAGVGFEGYLVWAGLAAVFAGQLIRDAAGGVRVGHPARLAAAKHTMTLIVVWCTGSVLMRVTDLVVAVGLDLPRSPYDTAAMAAFDAVTAVLAFWLRINLMNGALPAAVIWSAGAILFGFTIARILVGVSLAPHLDAAQRAAALAHPVYGNGLAQQITSTFDVVVCGLALYALTAVIIAARAHHPAQSAETGKPGQPPRIFRAEAPTQRLPTGAPQIFRGADQGSSNGS